jgi:hypothetical protein
MNVPATKTGALNKGLTKEMVISQNATLTIFMIFRKFVQTNFLHESELTESGKYGYAL